MGGLLVGVITLKPSLRRKQFQRLCKTGPVDAEISSVVSKNLADLIFFTENKAGGIDDAKSCLGVFILNLKGLSQIVQLKFKEFEDSL